MNPAQLFLSLWIIVGLLQSPLNAQPAKSVPRSQLAVDVVNLKSGQSVRGAFLNHDASKVVFAVSRDWFQRALPDMYQKQTADEERLRMQVAEQLRGRLKKELETATVEPRIMFFLKAELGRVELALNGRQPTEPTQFVGLSLSQNSIAKMTRAAPDRLHVAAWAWNESLANVETRDVRDLERELKQRGIDLAAPLPDLTTRLPPQPQNDREWAARMAIIEYTLGSPVDFQGTTDLLVRTDGGKKEIEFAPILAKLMQSQINSMLTDVSQGVTSVSSEPATKDWLKSASRQADQDSARGLRATQVVVNPDGKQAVVQASFAAKMPDKTWELIWFHRETRDATAPKADIETRIVSDPQVKQLLHTLSSVGLNADGEVQKALRFGAATMEAQQATDAKFFEFRDRYVKHLDGPPLTWTK